MIRKYLKYLILLTGSLLFAQESPWVISSTDCNATILLPSDLEITLNGSDFFETIWVGVGDTDGNIFGSAEYTPGNGNTIAAFGFSGDFDGFQGGEEFTWYGFYNNTTVNLIPNPGVETYSCNGLVISLTSLDIQYSSNIIVGCTDEEACNYDPNAVEDDGSCLFFDICGVCDGDGTLCFGCIDETACNFGGNSITIDDGSCEYESCSGCTDFTACNFNPIYTIDDGSCDYSCIGCTDINACNYSLAATIDDGSCDFISCIGCSDTAACNYDSFATISCLDDNATFDGFTLIGSYLNSYYYVSNTTSSWTDANSLATSIGGNLLIINSQEENDYLSSLVDGDEVFWLGLYQNIESPNFSEPDGGWELVDGSDFVFTNWQNGEPNESGFQSENYATVQFNLGWNDGANADILGIGTPHFSILEVQSCCIYTENICDICDENGNVFQNDFDGDGVCDDDEVFGCTDQTACNYNIDSTEDDGSCFFININDLCSVCSGENDGTGFIINNDQDSDGLCDDEDPCPENPLNDVNNNGIPDCEEITGCTDQIACNYYSSANTDDLSCVYAFDCDYCSGENDGSGTVIDGDSDNDGICDVDEVSGCTNPNSCNYNELATDDDGSCENQSCIGCLDPTACNYCEDCTTELSSSCNYDSCCDDSSFTNFDPNCNCPDSNTCFSIPDGCDFNCFSQGEGIFPIPVTSVYGAFEISCFGASDGFLTIDFNTMNLISDGAEPYTIQVYQQLDLNNDGLITADEETYITNLTEDFPTVENLVAANYVLLAYDNNGCCGQTLLTMNQPGENSLNVLNYDDITCPGGTTDINFTIEGAVGQFDVTVNGDLYLESIDGGTVTVSTDDSDNDGVPDDFVILDSGLAEVIYGPNQNFWPDVIDIDGNGSIDDNINDCQDAMTIYINIENNENIQNGDLIGAFYTLGDGTLQSFTYTTYVASSGGSSFLTMQVCGGNDNGFNNGEEIVFLVYDVSEDIINEVEVQYELINSSGTFTDIFETNSTFDGIWISSLSVIGESGSVPDFSITVQEGQYNISINRSTEIDSDGDGLIDQTIVCNVIDTILNISDPDNMQVDIVTGGSVCNYYDDDGLLESTPNGYIQLDNFIGGTPPYVYQWTNPNGDIINQSFSGGIETLDDFDSDGVLDDLDFVGSGLYTLDVTDSNNCPFSVDVLIEGSDLLLSEFEIDYDLISCSGGSTSVDISLLINGQLLNINEENYYFEWFNNSTNNLDFSGDFLGELTLTGIQEANYTVNVFDESGCFINQDISIDVEPSGQIAIFNPTIDVLCGDSEGFVSFSSCPTPNGLCVTNGTPPFLYTWYEVNDLDNDGVFEDYINLGYPSDVTSTNLSFGTYSFNVTDSNGCNSELVFEVNQPDPIIFESIIDPILCPGDNASISLEIVQGNPGIYEFIFQGESSNITIGDASEIDFSWNPTDVNMTLLFNDVSIFSVGDVIGVFYTGDNGITCGGSFEYDGSSVFNVPAWGDDSSTTSDDGFDPGDEILILVNTGGIVYELEIIDYDNVFDSPFNYVPQGLSAITNVVFGDEFSQGPNFSSGPLEEGSYFIEVFDGNLCSWSELIEIEGVEEFNIDYELNNQLCYSTTGGNIQVNVSGGTANDDYVFLWTNDLDPSFAISEFGSSSGLSDLPAANYNLQVIDNNGCVESQVFELIVDTPEPDINVIDEQCDNDGELSVCVNWEGSIELSLTSTGFFESVIIQNNENDISCHSFTQLDDTSLIGAYTLIATTLETNCIYIDDQIIINPSQPIGVEFFTENPECYDGEGAVYITNIFGGQEPYSINWQGIQTNAVPVGVHQFTITDANGCEYTQQYVIQNSNQIGVNTSVINNICFGDSNGEISFNINGGIGNNYSYSLLNENNMSIVNGVGSSATVTSLPSGSYNILVNDDFGCTYSQEIIIVDLEPEITLNNVNFDDSQCFGGESIASINLSSPNNYVFNWYRLTGPDDDIDDDGIQNDEDFVISGGELVASDVGLSEITLTDIEFNSHFYLFVESLSNSCASNIVVFSISSPPEFNIFVDDIYLSCSGDIASVVADVSGGSDWDIDGDDIQNNIDTDIDGDGNYFNLDDCQSNCNDDDIDIDNDGIPNEIDDYIGGTLYNGLSTNSHPNFTNGLIYEDEFGNTVDPNNLGEGLYFVYSIDSNGCQSNLEEFEIISPNELEISLSYDYNSLGQLESVDNDIELLCYDDYISVIVNIIGGSPDPSNGYFINCVDEYGNVCDINDEFSSGLYFVSVTDSNNCSVTQSFTVLNEPDEIEIVYETSVFNNYNVSCNGADDGFIQLFTSGGTGNYTYTWSNGSENQNISNLVAGEYVVNVEDENGCIAIETIQITEPQPFTIEIEYIVDASCDEESDGGVLIRTYGGNPPLQFVVNGGNEIYNSYEGFVDINEGQYSEQVYLTNSDIYVSGLNANSFSTISIIDDAFNCFDLPYGTQFYVGSVDNNCLFIPSVFTPNGDGFNDNWQIDGIDLYTNPTVKVFNRWGQLVFESVEKPYVSWDGEGINNKSQEIATYYYVIDLNKDDKKYNGSVTIKR